MKCKHCKKQLSEIQIKRRNKCCSKHCSQKYRTRSYKYDTTFLNELNEFSAYFIGYFVADGYLSKEKQISIISKDYSIIYKFKRRTKHTGKIPKHKPDRGEVRHRILFSGPPANKLISLGFPCGAKTGKEFIPEFITDEYFCHFLRGFIDGDGCLCITQNRLMVQITCANNSMLEDINKRLHKLCGVDGGSITKCSNANAYNLVYGHNDGIKICDYIYKNNTICMNRKYEKYVKASKLKVQKYTINAPEYCTVEGCDNKYLARGVCKKHYRQLPDQIEKIRKNKRDYYYRHKKLKCG